MNAMKQLLVFMTAFYLSIIFVCGIEKCDDSDSMDAALSKGLEYTSLGLNFIWAVGGLIPLVGDSISAAAGIGTVIISALQNDVDLESSFECSDHLSQAVTIGDMQQINWDKFRYIIGYTQRTVNNQLQQCGDQYDGFNSDKCADHLLSALNTIHNQQVLIYFVPTSISLPPGAIIELVDFASYHRRIYDSYHLLSIVRNFEIDTVTVNFQSRVAEYLNKFYIYVPDLIKLLFGPHETFNTPSLKDKIMRVWWKQINFCGWKEYYLKLLTKTGDQVSDIIIDWFYDDCKDIILKNPKLIEYELINPPTWSAFGDWSDFAAYGTDYLASGFTHVYDTGEEEIFGNKATVAVTLWTDKPAAYLPENCCPAKADGYAAYTISDSYYCSQDSFLSGFRQYGQDDDESGNIGFEFVCRNYKSWEITDILTTNYNYIDSEYEHCLDFILFKTSCTIKHYQQGWTEWTECPVGQYIHSVSGQFSDGIFSNGLNNIRFKCAPAMNTWPLLDADSVNPEIPFTGLQIFSICVYNKLDHPVGKLVAKIRAKPENGFTQHWGWTWLNDEGVFDGNNDPDANDEMCQIFLNFNYAEFNLHWEWLSLSLCSDDVDEAIPIKSITYYSKETLSLKTIDKFIIPSDNNCVYPYTGDNGDKGFWIDHRYSGWEECSWVGIDLETGETNVDKSIFGSQSGYCDREYQVPPSNNKINMKKYKPNKYGYHVNNTFYIHPLLSMRVTLFLIGCIAVTGTYNAYKCCILCNKRRKKTNNGV